MGNWGKPTPDPNKHPRKSKNAHGLPSLLEPESIQDAKGLSPKTKNGKLKNELPVQAPKLKTKTQGLDPEPPQAEF